MQHAYPPGYSRAGRRPHEPCRRSCERCGTPGGPSALTARRRRSRLLDLWRRPEQYDAHRGSLRTFLLTKAHGKAVDLVRSESARSAREERSARETAAAGYDLDRYAWDLAAAEQVRGAVDGLPPDERKALEMAYFEGRTYREVARILGEPEGTVKSRIRSGLRRLRSALSLAEGEVNWTG